MEVFAIIVGVSSLIGALGTVAGYSVRDFVRPVRARHLEAQTVQSAQTRLVAMGPTQQPAESRAPERPLGATGWTEQVHDCFRVFTSPDGVRSWAPIDRNGEVDRDFAAA